MRITCCMTKATNTHLQYVILNVFRSKMFARTRLTITLYVHCLSCLHKIERHNDIIEGKPVSGNQFRGTPIPLSPAKPLLVSDIVQEVNLSSDQYNAAIDVGERESV